MNIEPDKEPGPWPRPRRGFPRSCRLASTEGPQRIGTKARYVIVPEEEWLKREEPQIPLGRYLVENLPRGYDDLELPDRAEPERPPLFAGLGSRADERRRQMSVLLDTNVISELVQSVPNAAGASFLCRNCGRPLSPSSPCMRLEYGIELIAHRPEARRSWKRACERILKQYSHAILPIDARRSRSWRRACGPKLGERGRTLHLPDALIAATAKENGLTLATRNVSDFDYLGVAVIDPWVFDPSAR